MKVVLLWLARESATRSLAVLRERISGPALSAKDVRRDIHYPSGSDAVETAAAIRPYYFPRKLNFLCLAQLRGLFSLARSEGCVAVDIFLEIDIF